MPTIHIHGRVLPEGFRLTIEDLPVLIWEDKETGQRTTYFVNIIDSHIGVEITTEDDIDPHISQITNQAWELARAAVDGFCLHRGVGLTVTLSRLFNEDGTEQVLVPLAPGVDEFFGSENLVHVVKKGSLNSLYQFMTSDPSITLAFNDLISGITFPRTAEINCARCIDGIRLLIAGSVKMSVGASWKMMHDSLRVSEAYLKEITDLSKKPRHGDRRFIDPEIIQRVIKMTWIVLQRFIEFRSRDKGELPVEEFEILVPQTLQS